MKIQLNLILVFCTYMLAFSSSLVAQKNHKWKKTVASTPSIPEQFSQADAVMIYNFENRQTNFEDYRFFSRTIIKQRVKILTQLGLEKYGKIILPKKSGLYIAVLDARTIKQDGTIVDLDTKSDIKSMTLSPDDDLLDQTKYQVFSIPGLDVGDEFEMICIYEGYHLERGGTVFFHHFIPVLKNEFVIETGDKRIVIMAANRNQLPIPKIENNLNSIVFSWEMENLPGLYEERGNISAKTLPHFNYELNLDLLYRDAAPPNIQNWRDLLQHLNKNSFEVQIRKKKAFKQIFQEIVDHAKSDTPFDQLTAIQQYLNTIQRITIPEKDEGAGIEYFLAEKKADYNTLIKMYKALIEELGLPYQIGAGRSKFKGDIDLEFPTYVQISDILFVVKIGEDAHLLPLKSKDTYYEINEIPLDLTGTNIYTIDPSDKTSFQVVTLPAANPKKNVHLHKIKAKVDLMKNNITYLSEETFGGAFSTIYRNGHYELQKKKKLKDFELKALADQNISNIDSIGLSPMPHKPPYRYKLFKRFNSNQQITNLEDKVYKISLEHFLDHVISEVNQHRLLDYYPSFSYSDAYSYYFEFNQPVTLANKENIDLNVSNAAGSFSISIDQMKPNMILIRSKYILKSNYIRVSEIQNLVDLNNAALKADNEGMIITLE